MSNVMSLKYPIPLLDTSKGANYSWNLIERSFSSSNHSLFFNSIERIKLLYLLSSYGPSCSLDAFCSKYGYTAYSHFVEIFAKFYGICFNSSSFITAEDYLIRILYLYFGKYTNIAVKHVFDMSKLTGYVMKSPELIQSRVDFLGKGSNFSRKYSGCLPPILNIKKMGNILVPCVSPCYRTPYTHAELTLLRLNTLYNKDFLPWKDSTEKLYILNNPNIIYTSLYKNDSDVLTVLNSKYKSLVHILLKSTEMQSASFDWTSSEDILLVSCLKNIENSFNNLQLLFQPLLVIGKTVSDCQERRLDLHIRVAYTKSELRDIVTNSTITASQRSVNPSFIPRSLLSLCLKENKIIEQVGKPLLLMTSDEKNQYLHKHNLV